MLISFMLVVQSYSFAWEMLLTPVFHTNRTRIAVQGISLLFLLMAVVFQPLYIYHLLGLACTVDYVAAKCLLVLARAKRWPDRDKTSQPGIRTECFPDLLWLYFSQLPYLDLCYWQRKFKKGAVSRICFFPSFTLAESTFNISGASYTCESYCSHCGWCWCVTCTPAVWGGVWRTGEAWKSYFHKVTPWLQSWVQHKYVLYSWYCHSGALSKWLFFPTSCICLRERGGRCVSENNLCILYRNVYM